MSDGSIVREQGSSSFTDGKAKKKVDLVRTYVKMSEEIFFFLFAYSAIRQRRQTVIIFLSLIYLLLISIYLKGVKLKESADIVIPIIYPVYSIESEHCYRT